MRPGSVRARALSACSKSEIHVAREDTKFARNNLKVNYHVKVEIEQQQQHHAMSG